jgi:hypothetical protein
MNPTFIDIILFGFGFLYQMQIFNTSDFGMRSCFSHTVLIVGELSSWGRRVAVAVANRASTSNGEKNVGCDFLHFPEALFVKDGNLG